MQLEKIHSPATPLTCPTDPPGNHPLQRVTCRHRIHLGSSLPGRVESSLLPLQGDDLPALPPAGCGRCLSASGRGGGPWAYHPEGAVAGARPACYGKGVIHPVGWWSRSSFRLVWSLHRRRCRCPVGVVALVWSACPGGWGDCQRRHSPTGWPCRSGVG
ncbi:MAG: hypothetical protein H7836_14920 [Magnetococcus sp. YQC-3]